MLNVASETTIMEGVSWMLASPGGGVVVGLLLAILLVSRVCHICPLRKDLMEGKN